MMMQRILTMYFMLDFLGIADEFSKYFEDLPASGKRSKDSQLCIENFLVTELRPFW